MRHALSRDLQKLHADPDDCEQRQNRAEGSQEKFDRNEFSHALSGVRYRVYRDGKGASFEFDLSTSGVKIHGARLLDYMRVSTHQFALDVPLCRNASR